MTSTPRRDIGGLVFALFFVAAGVLTLYDTTTYADEDSASFPRAVAIGLIALAVLSALRSLMAVHEVRPGVTATGRRVLLPVVMLGVSLLMPFTGFLAAALLLFAILAVVSRFAPWTARDVIMHVIAAAIVVGGFYSLFRFGLYVPLP